ncbi:malate dehydrogenase, cytoplasmic [Elysia marginata]|uniref:Malate dehydrogenase, cytoplasmic n=1 Tax=Elysia marginata TaxID=1093978 RepID=A0AAV4HI90_9GAST|nr:malate dehydrogenase, cytoplasmic [Elysia marginata]
MAKFVVAGRSDCPYFARAELLGDRLAKNLSKFKLHKIMVQPDQWDEWLKKTCAEKGWTFSKSPIVWRELIDRGGKGVLIGGANEFQEYVKAYYDLESDMNSYDMSTVSKENKVTKDELDQEEREFKSLSKPVHVCITNAAHPACYHMVSTLSSGRVLGPNTELTLNFLVSKEEQLNQVQGMALEAEDLAHGLLRGVKVYTNPEEAFDSCSYIILMDELLQGEAEFKVDWLKRNHNFFAAYGATINSKALSSCKVMLAGNGPLNFNAITVQRSAPNIARQNIVVVSSVIENHAKAVIGERLSVNPAGVVNLLVWGNINSKHFFDVNQCRIHGYDGAVWGPYWHSVDAREMVHDNKWLAREFPSLVGVRKQKVSDVVGRTTGLSTANAITTTLQHWCQGSPKGQIFSLGVYSERWYKIPEGLFFSVPVCMDPKGFWHVVQDIDIPNEIADSILAGVQDLKYQLAIFKGEISEHEKARRREMKLKKKSLDFAGIGSWLNNIEETEPAKEEEAGKGNEVSPDGDTEGEEKKAEEKDTEGKEEEEESKAAAGAVGEETSGEGQAATEGSATAAEDVQGDAPLPTDSNQEETPSGADGQMETQAAVEENSESAAAPAENS